ncbi:MAG: hypothetical protein PW735_12220 [Acidobacteriaceae bacterium]|nr:hypothetical protein [Acidobacteriaceae bacterium]
MRVALRLAIAFVVALLVGQWALKKISNGHYIGTPQEQVQLASRMAGLFCGAAAGVTVFGVLSLSRR